jgi:beta-galactosidase
LKAVGKKDGKVLLTSEVKTAGTPAKIVLEADRNKIKAGGEDLSFISVKVVDEKGVVVPNADNLVKFSVAGEGKIAGVDNGCQTSLESFKADNRKAFNGLCLLVVQSKEKAGKITVNAASEELKGASIEILNK